MSRKAEPGALIFGMVVMIIGVTAMPDWQTVLGVFFMIWSNNICRSQLEKTNDKP